LPPRRDAGSGALDDDQLLQNDRPQIPQGGATWRASGVPFGNDRATTPIDRSQ
jgi:hypothetical protein